MKNKTKFYLTLVIFSLIGQIAWVVENMYFNVFIYKMFGANPSDISAMVMASAVMATLTTLLIGALSDKLGKRKVFISFGYILWGISILSFALIRKDVIGAILPASASVSAVCITLVIVMDCVMTFFGSSANDACFNAWLTDSTTSENRGRCEGINSMMPLMAILVVFGGFMSFDLDMESSWTTIFIIIGTIVMLIGIMGLLLIEEKQIMAEENKSYFKNIFYGFLPRVIRENKKLYIYLIAFALFGISIQIFMPYLIIYYEVSLAMPNYVLVMAPAIVLAGVFTFFYGRVYDGLGFKKSIIAPLVLLALGYVMLILFKSVAPVFVGSLLMMCGYLSGMAVFGAVIRDYTPLNKSGMFQGLRIVGQVLIPGIIGPFIGRLVLRNAETIVGNDGVESFVPNTNIFISALAVILVLAIMLALVVWRKSKNEAEQN